MTTEKTLKLLIIILLIGKKSFAYDSSHVNKLRDQMSYNQNGPNCFSTTLYATGLLNSVSMIGSNFITTLMNSPYCEKISAKSRKAGDIAIVSGFRYRMHGYTGHAAMLTSRNSAISKNGFENNDFAKQIIEGTLDQNPGSHFSKECHFSLFDSSNNESFQNCFSSDAVVDYYRCNIIGLKSFFNKSEYFQPLATIRLRLQNYIEINSKLGPTEKLEVEKIDRDLFEIEKKIIKSIQKKYPKIGLINPLTKRLDPEFTSYNGTYYPGQIFNKDEELSIDFKLITIVTMMVVDIRMQILFLLEKDDSGLFY